MLSAGRETIYEAASALPIQRLARGRGDEPAWA